jgi:tetratricopeptide (TPR) repeat protein
MPLNAHAPPSTSKTRTGARYQVEASLGRGGMATVHRAWDTVAQRHVALKRLTLPEDGARHKELLDLFQGEFHALAQLAHPRVIEVYDYGVDEAGPYYTMELLDGGDLRGRCPMAWREACALLSGVCSSLALIHSRRLVHRDVSPANVWCTRDGEAKLIDFGALAPMGAPATIVGTAAFVAPEVVHQDPLDGRADLFSLGATLYYALTGRAPYPARTFAQLVDLWAAAAAASTSAPFPPPSSVVEGIPQSLDALVLSLVALEPAMRPRTAFEVMQRLTAIAGIERVEPLSVSQAYLATPVMVGRQEVMRAVRAQMATTFGGRGRGLLIEGESGVGRSRLLEACVLEAKMSAAIILKAAAATARKDGFAVAQSLAEQLSDVLPDPTLAAAPSSPVFDGAAPRLERQKALSDWLLRVAQQHPLLIAVDDVHEIDEPSAALLGVLASEARKSRLLVVATLETGAPQSAPSAIEVFASRSTGVRLANLTRGETEALLASLFGDVQNLALVADNVYRVSSGNPRACMDLARHMVDRGVVSYEGGAWTLPTRLDPSDLPRSAEDAMRDRIAVLDPLARWLAEAQSLANDTFDREDYRSLRSDVDATRVDRALGQLVSNQVLTADGGLFSIAHRGWATALTAGLGPDERAARHQALARLYEAKLPIVFVRHLLAGGEPDRGLDRLFQLLEGVGEAGEIRDAAALSGTELATILESALEAAKSLRRPLRQQHELRRWVLAMSVATEDEFYWRVAPEWLAQLERDSGLADWRSRADADPGSRLMQALGAAGQRYATTPENERVYRPDEAIKHLCFYTVISIAIGARSLHGPLLESLPGLLEPFAPMIPVVEILRQNAIATFESRVVANVGQSRARWTAVYEQLGKMSKEEMPYVDALRNAVAFGLGSIESRLGLQSALRWTEVLDRDELQRVNAYYLRKIVALQLGDAEAAERWRRQAEVLALQARVRQMFTTTLPTELVAHVLAEDLTGVRQVLARMQPLTRGSTAWQAYVELGEAQFQLLRGDLNAARARFERCIEMASPGGGASRPVIVWPQAMAGYAETLVGLGRYQEAADVGQRVLDQCKALGVDVGLHEVSRATALAEAKLGRFAEAASRLDTVIEEQTKIGTVGLMLGASYEARARVAILAKDDEALEKYANLAGKEYRHGRGSPLAGRWGRLMAEARSSTKHALPALTDFVSTGHVSWPRTSPTEMATALLKGASTPEDRALRALKLLCDDRGAGTAFLYLVGDRGLRLAACYGADAPPDGLVDFLNEYLEGELDKESDQTSALTGPSASAVLTQPRSWQSQGTEYRPLLMTSRADEGLCHVGVVAFAGQLAIERPAGGPALVAALSAHLLQSGDTRGVAA